MRRVPGIPQDRLLFVEGLRGLAALFVVFSHFRSMIAPGALSAKSNHLAPWFQSLLSPLDQSHLAVAAFIVLSGFCLQVSLFNGKNGRISDLKQFFKRRAWRILPAYYACLAISVVVALTITAAQPGMPFSQYVPVTWQNTLMHVGLVHNFSPDSMYKINGVLWSIALEAQLYLVFPLLVFALFRIGRFQTLFLTLGLALAVMFAFPEAMKLYPWFLPLFALGMVAGHFAYRPHPKLSTAPWIGIALFWIGMTAVPLAVQSKQFIAVSDFGIGVAVAGLIYLGSVAPTRVLPRICSWKPIVAIGGFSYSLYLMHHPILQILYVYRPGFVTGPAKSLAYLVLVGLPLILIACYIFSLMFERPFIRTRKAAEPRDGLGTPVSLPLRTMDTASEPDYVLAKPRFRRAVVEVAAFSPLPSRGEG